MLTYSPNTGWTELIEEKRFDFPQSSELDQVTYLQDANKHLNDAIPALAKAYEQVRIAIKNVAQMIHQIREHQIPRIISLVAK